MIWIAVRQHRTTILSMLLAITVAAALMIFNWLEVIALGGFVPLWPLGMQALAIVGGSVVGASVFGRDLSTRSHMFSLTQSVSRQRWWLAKVAVVLLPLLAAMLALGAIANSTFRPLLNHNGGGPFALGNFDSFGLIPAAYFLVAFTVAIALSLFWKSIVGSLIVAALVTAIIATTIALAVRPHYMSPVQERTDEVSALALGWEIDSHYVESGAPLDQVSQACEEDSMECQGSKHDLVLTHHPMDRLETFQGIETGIYVLLASGFLGASAVAVRKRLP